MALRLSDHVLCGEIINTGHYSVHGWLGLRGCRRPLLLQLTGDCGADLKGRHIRFEIQGLEDEEESDPDSDPDAIDEFDGAGSDSEPDTIDTLGLAWQQIGPTGAMTADRKAKVSDCPPGELYLRTKLDEPPPFEWKRLLYLEWFSQNGRVVLELADPVIEFVEEDDSEVDLAANGKGNAAENSPGELLGDSPLDDDAAPDGLDIEAIHLDEDGNAYFEDLTPGISEDADEEENPFGVVSDELQRQFDADAHQTDWEIQSDEDKPRSRRELELMDDLIANSPGEPIVSIFDTPVKLPSPDKLDDSEAEEALKTLLAQLAMYGIALDVCEHFTPRDCYRVLIENICREEHVYPELRDTQWVQHFATSDYCEACLAEFDEEQGESPGME
jgi:hypothetical protein